MDASDGYCLLTEREKQTLRLIVRGHDAKSIARHLDLSVHTINERLREARRKLAVPSSREAARRLLAREGGTPDSLVPTEIGEAGHGGGAAAVGRGRRISRPARFAIGVVTMTVLFSLLVLAAQPQPQPAAAPTAASTEAVDPAAESAARRFLDLVDRGRWDESYALTGTAFRRQNTARTWATVSEKVRPPLGAVVSRTLLSQQNLPAPPNGYEVLKFRTSFANQADTMETVTLEREGGAWRVVAIVIG